MDQGSGGESSFLYTNWSLVLMSLLIIHKFFCMFLLRILQIWPCWLLHPSASSAWLDLNFKLFLFVISLILFVFHCSPHNDPSSPALPTLISQTAGPDLFLGCLCCCLAVLRQVLLPASQGTTKGCFLCRQKLSLQFISSRFQTITGVNKYIVGSNRF